MATNKLSGSERFYVQLIDSEPRKILSPILDKDGNAVSYTTKEVERDYMAIFTGYTSYIAITQDEPQFFSMPEAPKVKVPVLGDIAGKASAGKIMFNVDTLDNQEHPTRRYSIGLGFSAKEDFNTKIGSTSNPEATADTRNTIQKSKDTIQKGLSNYKQYKSDVADIKRDLGSRTPESFVSEDEKQAIMNSYVLNQNASADEVAEKERAIQKEINEKGTKLRDQEIKESIKNKKDSSDLYIKKDPKQKWDAGVQVVFSFIHIYDKELNQYVLASGQYVILGYGSYDYSQQWIVYCVPLYLQVSVTMSANLSGRYNTVDDAQAKKLTTTQFRKETELTKLLSPEYAFQFGAEVEASAGIGFVGVLGVRGIVKFKFIGRMSWTTGGKYLEDKGGTYGQIGGGIGIDLVLFHFKFVATGDAWKSGVFADDYTLTSAEEPTYEIRPNNLGDADISSFGTDDNELPRSDENGDVSLASIPEPVSQKTILSNTVEYSRPKMVSLSDGRKLLVFIAEDKTRSTINKETLYYAIQNTDNSWTVPQVVDNDGTFDSLPTLSVYEDTVYVAWSNAKRALTDDEDNRTALSQLEIVCSEFNSKSNTFTKPQQLTDDEYFDGYTNICYEPESDTLVLSYLKRDLSKLTSDEQVADFNASYSTMAYKIRQNGVWNNQKLINYKNPDVTDPLVVESSVEVQNIAYTDSTTGEVKNDCVIFNAYTVDQDKNLETMEDTEVWLQIYDVTKDKAYYPLRLTNNEDSDLEPKLTKYVTQLYLTWVTGTTEFNMVDIMEYVSDIVLGGKAELFANADPNDPNWLNNCVKDEPEDSPYKLYEDFELCPDTVDFCDPEKGINGNVSNYKFISNNNGEIYLLWADDDFSNAYNSGVELYGASYQYNEREVLMKNSETDEPETETSVEGAFGMPVKISDTGKAIDEFDVVTDADNNMFLVAEMFEQDIDDSGNLVFGQKDLISISYQPKISIELEDGTMELSDDYPMLGDAVTVKGSVINNGLLAAKGYEIKAYNTEDGVRGDLLFDEQQVNYLTSSDSQDIVFDWTVPENSKSAGLEVEISEFGASGTKNYKIGIKQESDLYFDNQIIPLYGSTFIDSEITNYGNINSKPTIRTIYKYDIDTQEKGEKCGTIEIPEVAPDETINVLSDVNIADADVNEYGGCYMIIEFTEGESLGDEIIESYFDTPYKIVVNDGIDKINISKGNTADLSGKYFPDISGYDTSEIDYFSDDENIAVVENNKVVGLKNGTATIMAYDNSTNAMGEIEVEVTGGTTPSNGSSGNSGGSTGYSLQYKSGVGGTISGNANQQVAYDGTGT